jgi:hypothetical protein
VDDARGVEIGKEACGRLAVETLQQALAAGMPWPKNLLEQEPFAALSNSPAFVSLVRQHP